MNRNTRTAVVVGVAVLLAVIASLGMYRIVSRMPAKGAEVTTVDVVVAQHPLEAGYANPGGPREGRALAQRCSC